MLWPCLLAQITASASYILYSIGLGAYMKQCSDTVTASDHLHVRVLLVTILSDLNLESHVSKFSKTCAAGLYWLC